MNHSKHILLIFFIYFLTSLNSMAGTKPKIKVVGLFKDAAYIDILGNKKLLRVGQSTDEGYKLVSADSKQAIFMYKGEKYTYQIATQIQSNYSAVIATEVILVPDDLGMYHVSGWINDHPVAFLVDTGATAITINEQQAKSINIDYEKGQSINVHTASGVVQGFRLSLKTVRIDKLTLNDIEAIIVPGQFPKRALLGNSFLKHLDIQREGKTLKLIKKW